MAWVRSGVVLVNGISDVEIVVTDNNGKFVCIATSLKGAKEVAVIAKGNRRTILIKVQ